MKVKLIENWRKAYQMLSVRLAALVAMLAAAAEYFPEYVQWLPDGWVKWGALAILVGRVIHQERLHDAAK